MPHFRHELVLHDFNSYVRQSRNLVSAARLWIVPKYGPTRPRFTTLHRNMLIELAFMRSYLAWERFLEESFILYLLGRKPQHRRYAPKRSVTPRNWNHAFQLLLPETGRAYADWDNVDTIRVRAKRFFVNGEPFESALTPRLHLFQEIQVIRNAIAHRSLSSQVKFQDLVRDKLKYLPPNITVGGFLESVIAGTSPPVTYLDRYMDGMCRTAETIVP